jgi:hypothetical protein
MFFDILSFRERMLVSLWNRGRRGVIGGVYGNPLLPFSSYVCGTSPRARLVTVPQSSALTSKRKHSPGFWGLNFFISFVFSLL